jgi:hypothetical protein
LIWAEVGDKMLTDVKLAPPVPVISTMIPPAMLKAWSFVPAETLLNTTGEK